ncbi:methionyl-tRNA formyltransferase [Ferruginibacter sp. SUN106]|uniref:methionyl-tRNA formyltransferase n=1 Tax=Ferruginibacter sp. SUN106 TaxID=2978348 RepID=UPI003D360A79
MSEIKAILICGSSIAIPVVRDMMFHQQIAAVVIPQHCTAFAAQVQLLLKDSGVPVVVVNKKNFVGELQLVIEKHTPALGLVFTFSYKIPAAVYTLPPKGFFNIHPGPLPAYQGPDPIFQQIKNKEPYAAISIHKLDEGFDTGPIVMIDKMHLAVTDTYGMLSKKLGELASGMVTTLLKMAGFGNSVPARRQDHARAKFYKKQSADDITINWLTMDAAGIIALINACNPWNKGAVTHLNQNIIRLLDGDYDALLPLTDEAPGTIISIDEKGMKVATAAGQAMVVRMIYMDEGFLMAGRLKDFGIMPGARLGAA